MLSKDKIKYLRHEFRGYLSNVCGLAEIIRDNLQDCSISDLYFDAKILDQEAQNLDVAFKQSFYSRGEALEDFDFEQFKKTIYGPLYILLGLSQRLKKQNEVYKLNLAEDIDKLQESCRAIQALMEKHLSITSSEYHSTFHQSTKPEIEIASQRPTTRGKILLVEDNADSRKTYTQKIENMGHKLEIATDGFEALRILKEKEFDLVLLDILMPGMSGYEVLERIKTDPKLKHIPVIILSALDESDSVTQCLRLGAEDYLLKGHDYVIFEAKIDSCLEKKRIRDHERLIVKELRTYQELFERELAEAASYVRGFLPHKLKNTVSTDYIFNPSKKLGGDIFDYHWIDPDHFIFYLLDVSGHGIGAALLSVSVMNVLRSQINNKTDLLNPNVILEALNSSFLTDQQNDMYFTIWYGVYQPSTRILKYASAGSPPSVLIYWEDNKPILEQLVTSDLIIGVDQSYQYEVKEVSVRPNSRIYLFSDGVYEIKQENNRMLGFREFLEILSIPPQQDISNVNNILLRIQGFTGVEHFEDDFTLLELRFH